MNVEVTGSNIRIHAVFTPYLDDAGDLELVAQGQGMAGWWPRGADPIRRNVSQRAPLAG